VNAESRFLAALRRRFRTPQEVLRHLGLDEFLLDSGRPQMAMDHIRAQDLRSRSMGGYSLDERPRRNGAYDAVREAIDQLEPEDVAELVESLLEERGENWGEDRRRAADSRRRTARDDPPSFSGRPETGGGMTDPDNSYSSITSNDRRRGRAHDDGAVIIDEDFRRRFPEAARVRMA